MGTASRDDLLAYIAYIEFNLERIEQGGWVPICFAEFMMSAEREVFDGAETTVDQ